MWIERLLRDHGGTVVKFPDANYHFKPEQEGGPHIANVEPPEHIERFLSISHGYREHVRPEDAVVVMPPVPPSAPVEPAPTVLQAPVSGDLAAAIAAAAEATAPIAEATNAAAFAFPAPDEPALTEGEGQPPSEPDDEPKALPTEDQLKAMSHAELQAVYEAELGRKPQWNTGSDKLISAILSARTA